MEERFVLDNNNNVIDFEDKTDKYCLSQEDVCNVLNKQHQRIAKLEQELAELKEKLSKATQFETPHIERFAIVRYLAQKNEPYKIVNCYDCYRDKDYKIHYCFYNVKSMNFKLIEVFATEQEAQAKLKEIQGNE